VTSVVFPKLAIFSNEFIEQFKGSGQIDLINYDTYPDIYWSSSRLKDDFQPDREDVFDANQIVRYPDHDNVILDSIPGNPNNEKLSYKTLFSRLEILDDMVEDFPVILKDNWSKDYRAIKCSHQLAMINKIFDLYKEAADDKKTFSSKTNLFSQLSGKSIDVGNHNQVEVELKFESHPQALNDYFSLLNVVSVYIGNILNKVYTHFYLNMYGITETDRSLVESDDYWSSLLSMVNVFIYMTSCGNVLNMKDFISTFKRYHALEVMNIQPYTDIDVRNAESDKSEKSEE